MLGLAAGVFVLTVQLVRGRSQTVQNITLAGFVILCTNGLILGISAVATPPGARLTTRLPPNVSAVTLHRARIRPWVRVTASAVTMTPAARRWTIVMFTGSVALYTAFVMEGSTLLHLGSAVIAGLLCSAASYSPDRYHRRPHNDVPVGFGLRSPTPTSGMTECCATASSAPGVRPMSACCPQRSRPDRHGASNSGLQRSYKAGTPACRKSSCVRRR